MVFKKFTLKMQGMRKAQDFLIYPYSGGDTVSLQSDTRFMQLDLKSGNAILSKAHSNGSCQIDLYPQRGAYMVRLDNTELTNIQGYLWHNEGVQTWKGVLSIENKPLFSE